MSSASDKPSGARRTAEAGTPAPPAPAKDEPTKDTDTDTKGTDTKGTDTKGTVLYRDGDTAIIDTTEPEEQGKGPQWQQCVVDEGKDTVHVGRAVPGTKVCSYHTMHYDNEGNPRTGAAANKPSRPKAKAE